MKHQERPGRRWTNDILLTEDGPLGPKHVAVTVIVLKF
jgi:hypothetical protein